MESYALRIVLLLALAAWVSIDERVWPAVQISQPVLAGTLAGILAGSPLAGLTLGILVQALWPALVPSGGVLLPSLGLGAVIGGAAAAWGQALLPPSTMLSGRVIVLGLLAALTGAALGRSSEGMLRAKHAADLSRAEREMRSGSRLAPSALRRAVRSAVLASAFRGWAVAGVVLSVAAFVCRSLLVTGMLHLRTPFWNALDWAGLLLLPISLGLACGQALAAFRRRRASSATTARVGVVA